ncbi:MAG: M73 family metallopeptidase [Chloroflexi bacterium]|nr:M73 family metallopeptidase [Chloroflexota bacterium]
MVIRTVSIRERLLGFLLPAAALVAIGAGSLSLALFTDSATVDGTFTAGTISLDPSDVASLSLSSGALLPGDVLTDDVTITNDGTAELRYSVSTASTNADGLALRDVLTLTVREIDTTTPGTPCNDFDGALVVAQTAFGASSVGIGSPAAGAQAGDRTLAAASSETLCFRMSLPSATGNAYQGATTTTTFTFNAEQTANNP